VWYVLEFVHLFGGVRKLEMQLTAVTGLLHSIELNL